MIITISKGQQITIPSEFRQQLGLKVGSRVEVTKKGKKIVIEPIDVSIQQMFEKAKKIKPKRRLSAADMDKFVENEILRQ